VLLTGVIAGVYNAQFLAINILVAWEKGELRVPFLSRSRRAAA
jgi:preprotein translocase subunit SecF